MLLQVMFTFLFPSVTYNNLTADVCQLLQDAIKTALLGYNYSSHIATFGNSLPEKTGDWLEIAGGDGPTGSVSLCLL